MTVQEQKEQELLAVVKQFPGLATRQYWKKLGYSESGLVVVRARLLHLLMLGKVRCEESYRGEQVHSRCWWPV